MLEKSVSLYKVNLLVTNKFLYNSVIDITKMKCLFPVHMAINIKNITRFILVVYLLRNKGLQNVHDVT